MAKITSIHLGFAELRIDLLKKKIRQMEAATVLSSINLSNKNGSAFRTLSSIKDGAFLDWLLAEIYFCTFAKILLS